MGCGGSKDGSKGVDSKALEQKKVEIKDEKSPPASSTNDKGEIHASEVKLLVKHLYPNFINVCVKDIPLDDPKIKALDGKTKDQLVEHLNSTCDDTWVNVFHQFIGKGDTNQEFLEC